MKTIPFCIFSFALFSLLLSGSLQAQPSGVLSTDHLEHLTRRVKIGGHTLDAVWIYCEAPDYRLVADEDEGFSCVDDVARALVFWCRDYRQAPSAMARRRIRGMAAFLLHMHAGDGLFYNFLLPDGQINRDHINSVATPGWWTWRALWALSEVCLLESPALAKLQQQLRPVLQLTLGQLHTRYLPAGDARFGGLALPAAMAGQGADQAGLILLGLSNCYRLWPSEDLRSLMLRIGDQLLHMQQGDRNTPPYGAFLSWQNYWHAWGNLQAYGLLKAGELLSHPPFIEAALREVRDFYPWYMLRGGLHQFAVEQTAEGIRLTDVKAFPQIAYDRRPMVLAALEAYRITGDTTYAHIAGQLAGWLAGVNPIGQPMYQLNGRTFDGIVSPTQVNQNAGAESTIEALLCLQAIIAVPEAYRSFLDAQAALIRLR
jgi:hypothetical protein